MGRGQIGPAVDQFRHLMAGRSVAGLSEWQILRLYFDRRDEMAFGAIVARHGPMVLGVCRRLLADSPDVEDAFQATFLILARKGATLGEADPIGPWLYGVARRVALRARASSWRRRSREGAAARAEVATVDDPDLGELGAVVDEELGRLPSKYRTPIVLCYLEGLTHEEAGRHLGWPVGTVKGRLARARDLLKGRLARRGFAPTGSSGVIALVRAARRAVPSSLMESTIKVAMASPSSGMVPAAVASLATGSLMTMMLNKMKAVGVVLLILGTGAAALALQASGTPGEVKATPPSRPVPDRAAAAPPRAGDDVADWDAGWLSAIASNDQGFHDQAIRKKLDEPILMNFPNATQLQDVLQYIRQSTRDEAAGLPKGIPVYVVPQGLQVADKTMASPVSIDLEGIPLRTSLRLALKQLGLAYRIDLGLLIIDTPNSERPPSSLDTVIKKARAGELSREQYKQLIELLRMRKEIEGLADRPEEMEH